MHMRKTLLLWVACLFIALNVAAQSRTIRGKISDDKGNPLANATVAITGSSIGTTTNPDGTFSITVPSTAKSLIVSSVGMALLEVAITSSDEVNLMMKPSRTNMEEVVVVGYQTQKKREITAAISTVSGEDIHNLPLQSFDRA